MRRVRHAAALLAAMFLSGCGNDPASPIDPLGEYQLVGVGGQTLPASVAVTIGGTIITQVRSGTLRLWPDDTYTLVLGVQARTGDGPAEAAAWAFGGDFAIDQGSVALDMGEEIGQRTATLGRSAGAVTLAVDPGQGFGVLQFRKAADR